MIELKQHPTLKDLIPPLSKEEYQALKQDIQEHGIQVPIIHDAAGQIIDGWNRYLIAKELEIEAKTIEWEFPDNVERGISLNLKRRHLSKEQRDKLIVALREKGWTQKKVAEAAGVSEKTVQRKEMDTNRTLSGGIQTDQRKKVTPKEEKEIKEEVKKESQRKVAEKHGITHRTVGKIVKKPIEKKSLKDKVIKGKEDSKVLHDLKLIWSWATKEDREKFLVWVRRRK